MRPALLLALLSLTTLAHAEPVQLRLATIAPQGSAWAREFGAWARDIEAGTKGALRIKMYYSAIGGDEFTVLDRIKRDQLDGGIGSESCTRLGPSLKVTRIFGLFQTRDESFFVLSRLAAVSSSGDQPRTAKSKWGYPVTSRLWPALPDRDRRRACMRLPFSWGRTYGVASEGTGALTRPTRVARYVSR